MPSIDPQNTRPKDGDDGNLTVVQTLSALDLLGSSSTNLKCFNKYLVACLLAPQVSILVGNLLSEGNSAELPVTPKRTPKKPVAAAQRPKEGPAPKPTRMKELKAKETDGDDQNMRKRMDTCR